MGFVEFNWREMSLKVRKCHECGRKMYWTSFMIGSHNSVQREHFTPKMLKEIWMNPIFVLKCCGCFYHIPLANVPIRSV